VFQFQTIVLTDAGDNDDKVHVFMGSATANKTSQEKKKHKPQARDNQTINYKRKSFCKTKS
jgi:hypothetical protein